MLLLYLVTSSRSSAGIVAAKKLRKKSVFCVDNVSSCCTVEDMKSFVSNMSVEVLTCFQVKPRRRRDELVIFFHRLYRCSGLVTVYVRYIH